MVLNLFSKQAGLSAPQKSKIPMSTPGIDPWTFQCHAIALTTWLALLCILFVWYGTYFWNMFISVYICLYTCICVYMCAFTVYILNQGVYDQYMSLYGLGTHPCRGCSQRRLLLAVRNWYMQYEQIWARYVYVQICSNLWRIYNQIWRDLNAFKRPKKLFFWGIRSYDVNICVYIVNISFISVYILCKSVHMFI